MTVTWTDALQVLTGLGAVTASSVAVVLSGFAYRREANRDDRTLKWDEERRANQERAQQADLIAAWRHLEQPDEDDGNPSRIRRQLVERGLLRPGWGARLVNNSQLPAYDVTVRFLLPTRATKSVHLSLLPPGSTFLPVEESQAAEELGVEIRFRDVGGRVWERDRYGELRFVNRVLGASATVAAHSTVHGSADAVRRGDPPPSVDTRGPI